jgi:hypothetical protein
MSEYPGNSRCVVPRIARFSAQEIFDPLNLRSGPTDGGDADQDGELGARSPFSWAKIADWPFERRLKRTTATKKACKKRPKLIEIRSAAL